MSNSSVQKERQTGNNQMNVWNSYGFAMSGLGEKSRFLGKIKHFWKCLKWSKQRIIRGYSDYDMWCMRDYLGALIPDMLQTLKDNRHGSPGYLGENYTNEQGILVNDTCHDEWDKILNRMIFLWREIDEDSCSKQNMYEKEYGEALSEFNRKYGFFGSKLRTDEELRHDKMKGVHTVHFMDELPEYKEISCLYDDQKKQLEEYRNSCKDDAFDMLKQYYYDLWD